MSTGVIQTMVTILHIFEASESVSTYASVDDSEDVRVLDAYYQRTIMKEDMKLCRDQPVRRQDRESVVKFTEPLLVQGSTRPQFGYVAYCPLPNY